MAIYLCFAEEKIIKAKLIETTETKTTNGSMTNFRIIIGENTEMQCAVGNGFPVKIRKYLFKNDKDYIVEFDGLKRVEPQPLQQVLSNFCNFNEGNPNIRDCRWGLKIPLSVVEIIEEIEDALKIRRC